MQSDQQFWERLFPMPATDRVTLPVTMRLLQKNGCPFLLLPKGRQATAATFCLYPAQTTKARLVRNWLQRLSLIGLPLGRPVELRLSKEGFVEFLANLTQVQDGDMPQFGILAGNPAS